MIVCSSAIYIVLYVLTYGTQLYVLSDYSTMSSVLYLPCILCLSPEHHDCHPCLLRELSSSAERSLDMEWYKCFGSYQNTF